MYISSASNYIKVGQEFLQRDIYNFLNNNPTSITDINLKHSVDIYLIHVTNSLTIKTNLQNFKISVFNTSGQLVLEKKDTHIIDVKKMHTELYILKLQDLNSYTIMTKKFIRE